ncbi:CLUMA_CG002878, isoform A [Clunio marinus]|uniref:CLUMA_CG002878, isoform A n=1 Tax=Clunio marinus TaxID=568069 RepID=A0A1J1HNT6_9DIPT|nr:CLUMA_CG002878, isoform A [Clunio marinus]
MFPRIMLKDGQIISNQSNHITENKKINLMIQPASNELSDNLGMPQGTILSPTLKTKKTL